MKKLAWLFIPLAIAACGDEKRDIVQAEGLREGNPPARGFDQEGSDPEAVVWADAVMQAQGGRQAWDNTRYIGWTFFGRRKLLWDKQEGRVRIEVPQENTIYLIDLKRNSGRVQLQGEEVRDPKQLNELIERGKQIWINDSYWLTMPYKLKDSGVTLTYAGKDSMPAGGPAEILELRFKEVGYTPQNKYRVYIDPADSLVKAWAYYEKAEMDTPNFITPWQNYQRHGRILLSGDRGERQLSDISVAEQVDQSLFRSF